MSGLGEIYWVQFKTQLAIQFQYRVAMFIWMIGRVIEPLMYMVVWTTVAETQGGSVGGFTSGDFAAYYIVLMFVTHLTFTWIMYQYEFYIRSGTLAGLLLRPIHPIHKDIAENVAYKAMTTAVLIPVALVMAWLFQPTFDLQPWSLLAFVPALLLAAGLRFASGWALAMSAFWTTRVEAFNQIYFVAMLFFSGQLAPLELFPEPVRVIAALLPFRWMVAFPIELFLGRLGVREAVIGLGVQLIWMALCLVILRVVWSRGVKQFSAVGS